MQVGEKSLLLGEHARHPDPIGTPPRETLLENESALDAVGGGADRGARGGRGPRNWLTHFLITPEPVPIHGGWGLGS